jgi:hypothetical protein
MAALGSFAEGLLLAKSQSKLPSPCQDLRMVQFLSEAGMHFGSTSLLTTRLPGWKSCRTYVARTSGNSPETGEIRRKTAQQDATRQNVTLPLWS